MSRSSWKGSFVDKSLYGKSIDGPLLENRHVPELKVWSRASCIPECLVGNRVSVYSGRQFRSIVITRDRVGYKFGEFVFSRNRLFRNAMSKLKKGGKKVKK